MVKGRVQVKGRHAEDATPRLGQARAAAKASVCGVSGSSASGSPAVLVKNAHPGSHQVTPRPA